MASLGHGWGKVEAGFGHGVQCLVRTRLGHFLDKQGSGRFGHGWGKVGAYIHSWGHYFDNP